MTCKTPLAAILGSAGALRDLGESLDDDAKADLLATIIEESERLNRFIANLLDMTGSKSGAIAPNLAPHDLGEIVGTALQRAGKILARHQRRASSIAPDLPMVSSTPCCSSRSCSTSSTTPPNMRRPRRRCRSRLAASDDVVKLQVLDEGGGIPHEELERDLRQVLPRAESAIRCAPAPGWGSPSRAASSRPWAAPSRRRNRTDRRGRRVHDHAADPGTPPRSWRTAA